MSAAVYVVIILVGFVFAMLSVVGLRSNHR